MDETHHRFSSKGNKGGQTELRYASASFPRIGDRFIENASHTTGVYAFNLRGDPLPPLFILETASTKPANYKVDPRVGKGLPRVCGRYGQDSISHWPSCVAVRRKGSMDTSLWTIYNEDVILPCYKGRINPTPIRDPTTLKMIKGPLINKTDGGPGRLSNEAQSIEFRGRMATEGMHILLSLPNGTECTAELDQLYSEYKPACKTSTKRVA